MRESKLRSSLTLDPCLASRILLKLDHASAAIFANVLRLANFDPNQPRDENGEWCSVGEREVKKVVDNMVGYAEMRALGRGEICQANADSFRQKAEKAAEATVTWSHKRGDEPLFPPYVLQVNVQGATNVDEVKNLRDDTRLAALQIEYTLYVLKHRREALKRTFPDSTQPVGQMARLPDAKYQKVVDNFQAAYNGCRGPFVTFDIVKTGDERGTPFANNHETQLYTNMEGLFYSAIGEMHVRQSFAEENPTMRTAATVAHELGRRFGRQYEQNTGDPIWDVDRWDSYVSRINQPWNRKCLTGKSDAK